MAVFAIIHQSDVDPENLEAVLTKNYKNNFFRLTEDSWLVAVKGTAKEVSETIGFGDSGGPGSAVVFELGSYFGYAQKNVWEWISTKWEESEDG